MQHRNMRGALQEFSNTSVPLDYRKYGSPEDDFDPRISSSASKRKETSSVPVERIYNVSPLRDPHEQFRGTPPMLSYTQSPDRYSSVDPSSNQFISTHIQLKKLVRKIISYISFSSDALNKQRLDTIGTGMLNSHKQLMDELMNEKQKLTEDLQYALGLHERQVGDSFGEVGELALDNASFGKLQDMLQEVQVKISAMLMGSQMDYETRGKIYEIFDDLSKDIWTEFYASEPEVQQLEDERKKLENEHREYMTQLTTRITEKHKNSKRKVQALGKEKTELEHKIDRLQRELNSLQIASDAKDNLISTLEKRTKNYVPPTNDLELTDELRNTRKQVNTLQTKLKSSMSAIIDKEREIEALSSDLAIAQSESSESQLRLRSLSQPRVNSPIDKLKSKVSGLQREVDDLKRGNSDTEMNSKLQNTLLQMESERQYLNQELEREKRSHRKLQTDLKKLNAMLQSKENIIQQMGGDRDAEIKRVKEQLSKTEKKLMRKISSHGSMLDDLEQLNQAIAIKDDVIEQMKKQLEERKSPNKIEATIDTDIKYLKDHISELTETITKQEVQLMEQTNTIEDMETRYTDPERMAEWDRQLKQALYDSAGAKKTADELNKIWMQKLDEKERAHKRNVEEIQLENSKLKVDYNHLLEESCRVKSSITDHANEKANLQRSVDLLKQKLVSSEKQSESYSQQLEEAQKFVKPQIVSVARRVKAANKVWCLCKTDERQEVWVSEEEVPARLIQNINVDPTPQEFRSLEDKLRQDRTKFDDKLRRLQNTLSEQEEELRKNSVSSQEVSKLVKAIATRDQQLEELESENDKLSASNTKLRKDVQDNIAKLNELSNTYEASHTTLQARLNGYKNKNKDLKQQLLAASPNRPSNNELKARIRQLESDLDQKAEMEIQPKKLQFDNASPSKELSESKHKISNLAKQLKDKDLEIQHLDQELEKQAGALERADEEMSIMDAQIKKLTQRKGELKARLNAIRSGSSEPPAASKKEVSDQVMALNGEIGELRELATSTTHQLTITMQELAKTKTLADRSEANVKKLSTENQRVSKQLKIVQADYESILRNIKDLTKDLKLSTDGFFQDIRDIYKDRQDLAERCRFLADQTKGLREIVGCEGDLSKGVSDLKQSRTSLMTTVDDMNKFIEKIQTQLEGANIKVRKYKQLTSQLRKATESESQDKVVEQGKVEYLSVENVSMQQNLDTATNELSKLQDELEDVTEQMEEYKKRCDELEEELMNADDQAQDLKEKMQNAENNAQEDMDKAQNQLKEINDHLEKSKVLCQELEEEATKTKEDQAAAENELKECQQEVEQYKKMSNEQEEELIVADSEIQDLREKLQNSEVKEAEAGQLSSQLDTLKEKCDEYKSLAEKQDEDLLAADIKIQSLTEQLEDAVTSQDDALKRVSNELNDIKEANDQYKDRCQELEEELLTADDELAALKEKCSSLEELGKVSEELDDLREQLDESKNRCKELEEELQGADDEIATLKEKCSDLEKQGQDTSELEELRALLEQSKNRCEELEEELLGADDSVAALTEKCENLEEQGKASVELSEQLESSKTKCEKLKNQLSAADEEVALLTEKCKGLMDQVKDSTGQQDLYEQLEQSTTRCEELEEELIQADDEIAALKDTISNLEEMGKGSADLEDLRESLQQSKTRCDELEEELLDADDKVAELKEKCSALELKGQDSSQLEDLSTALEQSKTRCDELEEELLKADDEIAELKGLSVNLDEQMKSSQDLGEMREQLEASNARNQELEENLKASVQELDELKAQLSDKPEASKVLEETQSELKLVTEQLDSEKQISKQLELDLEDAEDEIAELKLHKESSSPNELAETVQQDLLEAKVQLEEYKQRCDELEEELLSADDQISDLQEKIPRIPDSINIARRVEHAGATWCLVEHLGDKHNWWLESELDLTSETVPDVDPTVDQYNELKKKLDMLQAESSLSVEVEGLSGKVQRKREKLQSARIVVNESSEQIKELKQQVDDLENDLEYFTKENDDLKSMNDEFEDEAKVKDKKVQDLVSQIAHLQDSLQTQPSKHETSTDSKQGTDVDDQIRELKEKLTSANEFIEELQGDIEIAQQAADAANEEVEAIEEEKIELEVRIADLQDQLDEKGISSGRKGLLQMDNQEEMEVLKTQVSQANEDLENLQEAKSSLERQLESDKVESATMISEQYDKIQALTSQIEALDAQLSEREDEISALQPKSSDRASETQQEKIEALEEERDYLDDQIRELEDQIKEAQASFDGERRVLKDIIEKKQDEIDGMSQQTDRFKQEIDLLKDSLSGAMQAADSSMSDMVKELQRKSEKRKKTADEYLEKLQQQKTLLATTQEELADAEDEIINLRKRLQEAEDDIQSHSNTIEGLTSANMSLEIDIKKIKKKHNQSLKSEVNLSGDAAKAMEMTNKLQTDNELLRQKLIAKDESIDNMQIELEQKLDENRDLADRIDELAEFQDDYNILLKKLIASSQKCGFPEEVDGYFNSVFENKLRIENLSDRLSQYHRRSGGSDPFNVSQEAINFSSLSVTDASKVQDMGFINVVRRISHDREIWCLVTFPQDEEGPGSMWFTEIELIQQKGEIDLPDIDPTPEEHQKLQDKLQKFQQDNKLLQDDLQELEYDRDDQIDALKTKLERIRENRNELRELVLQAEQSLPGDGNLLDKVALYQSPSREARPIPVQAIDENMLSPVIVSEPSHGADYESDTMSFASVSDIANATPEELQQFITTLKNLVRENEELERTIQLQENQLKLIKSEQTNTAKKLQSETIAANVEYLKELFYNFASELPALKNDTESLLRVICNIFEYNSGEIEEMQQKRGIQAKKKPAKSSILKNIFSKRKKKN